MSEKTWRYLCIISIVFCFLSAGGNGILGKGLFDNQRAAKQFENDYSAAQRTIVSLTNGLERISEESRRRTETIRNLQRITTELRSTVEQLEEANQRLREANIHLENFRKKLEERNNFLEEANQRIGKTIAEFEEILQDITAGEN